MVSEYPRSGLMACQRGAVRGYYLFQNINILFNFDHQYFYIFMNKLF